MEEKTRMLLHAGELLPLMESFYSIQGEGYFSGSPAFFLRIGGCDVGCHWCDVKESWNADLHPPTSLDNIIDEIKKESVNTVVITGGEPLMWNLTPLTNRLKIEGYNVHLETSGAYPLSGSFDWICLSPKKQSITLDSIKKYVNELKIIVHNKNDFQYAEEQRKNLSSDCKLYLQPEWSKKNQMIPQIIEFVKSNNHWLISLQNHKYMNIP